MAENIENDSIKLNINNLEAEEKNKNLYLNGRNN